MIHIGWCGPSRKHGDVSTLPVCILWEHPPPVLSAGEIEGAKAAALKLLDVGTHLCSGPVEETWDILGGSEYPQSVTLSYEVAQCIFTSVKPQRLKILGHVLQASFIFHHELDISHNAEFHSKVFQACHFSLTSLSLVALLIFWLELCCRM